MEWLIDMGRFFLAAVLFLGLIAVVYAMAEVMWDRLIARGWDGIAIGLTTVVVVVAALYWFVWRD